MRRITDSWGRWFLWGVAALAVVVFLAGMGIIGFALVIVFREEWNDWTFSDLDYLLDLIRVAVYLVPMTLPFLVAVGFGVFVKWPFESAVSRSLAAGIGLADILFVIATIAFVPAFVVNGDNCSADGEVCGHFRITVWQVIVIVSMMLAPGTFMAGFLGVLLGSRIRPRIVGRP